MNAFLCKATEYYGRETPGWVAVVRGIGWHFSGSEGKKEAETAVNNANKT